MDYNYNMDYNNEYVENDYNNYFSSDYIWIIIVVIAVIIMTIIGYVADKKNLIKKKHNKNQNSKKNINQVDKIDSSVVNNIQSNKVINETENEISNNNQSTNDIIDSSDNLGIITQNAESDEPINSESAFNGDLQSNQEVENTFSDEAIEANSTVDSTEKDPIDGVIDDNNIGDDSTENDIDDNSYQDNVSTFTEEIPDKVDNSLDNMYELNDDDEEIEQDVNLNLINEQEENKEDNIVDMELPDIDSIETDNTPDDFWKF